MTTAKVAPLGYLSDQETKVDLLNNEAIARTIVRLIHETVDSAVTIGVHGDWGAGKSSVLEMIEAAFPEGGDVPFMGSGTTLIAAETTGRTCSGIELDPLYVDIAVRRWQAFTGTAATLLADGATFDAIADRRLCLNASARGQVRPRRRGAK